MPAAKITITIDDSPNGTVKIEMTPSAETLLMKIASHGDAALTPAETYAMAMINRAREVAKSPSGRIILPVPRVRGRSL